MEMNEIYPLPKRRRDMVNWPQSKTDNVLDIRQMKRLGVILTCAILIAACSAPGTPKLRTSNLDGQGLLVSGCKNVSKRVRVDQYITDFYLSTWSSAAIEGAMEGFWEGLREGFGIGTNPSPYRPNSLPFPLEPFCMSFRSPAPAVSRAVARVLPHLGNPVVLSDVANGFFETGFVERSHRAARWRDRYMISVEESSSQTVVKILRILYISRGGPFNQAISVGHNEAWFLTQIIDHL